MCEKCLDAEHKKVDESVARKGLEAMKAWAAEPIDAKGALEAIDPERLEQENIAMREAIGLSLEEVWGLYQLLGEGESVILGERESMGLRDWMTILIRSRVDMQIARDRAIAGLELATALLQVQNSVSEKLETVH